MMALGAGGSLELVDRNSLINWPDTFYGEHLYLILSQIAVLSLDINSHGLPVLSPGLVDSSNNVRVYYTPHPPKHRSASTEIWFGSRSLRRNIKDWDHYIFLEKSSNIVLPGAPLPQMCFWWVLTA